MARADIIELCVRWYIAHRPSYLDLIEMMAERDVKVAHYAAISEPNPRVGGLSHGLLADWRPTDANGGRHRPLTAPISSGSVTVARIPVKVKYNYSGN